MHKVVLSALSLAFIAVIFAVPAPASAQQPQAVAQVITLDIPPAEVPAFVARIVRAQAIADRLGTGARIELWMSTVAGTESNQLSVVVHYDSIEAWAAGLTANAADAEWIALLAELQATGNVPLSSSLSGRIL